MVALLQTPSFWLCVLAFAPIVYLILNSVLPALLPAQDLKKKYGAKWALVTGSSSGIGKELARTLLGQELDVILVAREEPVFGETVAELSAAFPARKVVRVDANLSDPSGAWMDGVRAAIGDNDVQCVFLNAGFIVTGMFEQNAVQAHLANLHCNLTANIWLSHFLYERMLAKQLGGCIVFTSSSASYIPNPFAVLYGATKSGVSAFAASLACEARPRGIHVHSIHPSPVNSRFTAGGGNAIQQRHIQAMASFYKFASGPEVLPRKFLSHIGRGAIVADLGGVSVALRLVIQLLGYNTMAILTACTAHLVCSRSVLEPSVHPSGLSSAPRGGCLLLTPVVLFGIESRVRADTRLSDACCQGEEGLMSAGAANVRRTKPKGKGAGEVWWQCAGTDESQTGTEATRLHGRASSGAVRPTGFEQMRTGLEDATRSKETRRDTGHHAARWRQARQSPQLARRQAQGTTRRDAPMRTTSRRHGLRGAENMACAPPTRGLTRTEGLACSNTCAAVLQRKVARAEPGQLYRCPSGMADFRFTIMYTLFSHSIAHTKGE